MKREKPSADDHRFFTPSKMAEPPSPSPTLPPSSSLFKDLSNFKTPMHSRTFRQPQTTPQFLTASKKTPSSLSSVSRRRRPSMSATATARRLRQVELEQEKSSRKEYVKKERSMKLLATSLTAWLNFLFENPRSCGCDVSGGCDDDQVGESKLGKRESDDADVVQSGGAWRRLPKRQREEGNNEVGGRDDDSMGDFPRSKFVFLRDSLKDVCSFDDLKERMWEYLSLDGCKEVFTTMTQVAKNIDEGRLKMKAHCPILTDVGMRKKALKVLMCYNSAWLRIGLYIISGGESLLCNEDSSSEQEIAFLKMVIEKQFFSHSGLAKTYAYNKLVDGLYRPGYFEALGNILLKRFLLLVLLLDRCKCQGSLPVNSGIDGLDGGSLLLFNVQSNIKSSRQMINDFLSSEVMHGEGNLVTHLMIVGYKVSYQQIPLVEYDFRVTDLFQDIQDGVRLCRAIQLLQQDSSILMKVVLPSDTPKKKLANCGIALQYLKQAGVPLHDDDGTVIVAEDVTNGDKELALSLLWNIFVHLQLPLLVTKTVLSMEVRKIRKAHTECMDFDSNTHLDMLLNWMKAICENYDMEITSLASLVDGKAMWCLLDFYFRKELHCSCSMKNLNDRSEETPVSMRDTTDAVHKSIVSMRDTTDAVHNFVLSQKLTTLLGNFPEVLQICDILEHNGACNDRSVVILLVFLCSQLLVKKSKDQLNFHKLMGCHCQTPERKRWSISSEAASNSQTELSPEDAVKKFKEVQGWWQEMAKQNGNCTIQPAAIAPFSTDKCSSVISIGGNCNAVVNDGPQKYSLMENEPLVSTEQSNTKPVTETVVKIQHAWRRFLASDYRKNQHVGATTIQSHFRGWAQRRRFLKQKQAAVKIQSILQSLRSLKDFNDCKVETRSAIVVQSWIRGWIARKNACKRRDGVILIQSHCRRWFVRHDFLCQKEAALRIQTDFRAMLCSKAYHSCRNAAIEIQRFVRGWNTRTRLLGASSLNASASRDTSLSLRNSGLSIELTIVLNAIMTLQRWWRKVLQFKLRKEAAVVLQSYIRGCICRQNATKYGYHAVLIQAHWKGYIARKHRKGKLLELRLRIQKSAANVHDEMRIINRLIAALKELKSMKNVSGILHNCATLDLATTHSQKCCERLVYEGAIDILLNQIRSVTRSIPDQEVLKHCLSTLGNLARYPRLADALLNHRGSVETILWELLRNKEEGYFIACDLLKKLCRTPRGVEAIRSLPFMLKRLHALVEDLTKKVNHEKRNHRGMTARECNMERRLRESLKLISLIN